MRYLLENGRLVTIHAHLCPVCFQPFQCVGIRCASYGGVAHVSCVRGKRWQSWARVVASWCKPLTTIDRNRLREGA